MAFKLKKVMEMVGPSAALAFAAWLLQLLEQRHAATQTRYRELIDAFRNGADGRSGVIMKDDIDAYRQRTRSMFCATRIGMTAGFLLLLSLMIGTPDAVLEADWPKLFGAPANMLRLLLVIPAAVLVIAENAMTRKRQGAGLGDRSGCNDQQPAGASCAARKAVGAVHATLSKASRRPGSPSTGRLSIARRISDASLASIFFAAGELRGSKRRLRQST